MGASVITKPEQPQRDSYEDVRPRLWTVDEYHLAQEREVFRPGERLELIDGTIYETWARSGPRPRRWTVDEYHQAAEVGILQPGERLELIDGEVFDKVSPMGTPHAAVLSFVTCALQAAFGSEFVFRQQSPVALTGFSELEPDFAVVRGKHRDYLDHHPIPSEICLIVEISDSTLAFDQKTKAPAYAAAGISDYWIVNLVKDQLEVHRNPSPTAGYQDKRIYRAREFVTPLAAPQSRIKVAELLP